MRQLCVPKRNNYHLHIKKFDMSQLHITLYPVPFTFFYENITIIAMKAQVVIVTNRISDFHKLQKQSIHRIQIIIQIHKRKQYTRRCQGKEDVPTRSKYTEGEYDLSLNSQIPMHVELLNQTAIIGPCGTVLLMPHFLVKRT